MNRFEPCRAALRLLRSLAGLEAADELLLLLDIGLLLLELPLLRQFLQLALLDEGGVISLVALEPAAASARRCARRQAIEQKPVVARSAAPRR